MGKPTLYLMLGYPGAGKTTTAKLIHELTGSVHLWADQIRNERYPNPSHSHQENLELYNYLNEMTAELLATGQSVIFDTGFNFYKDRQHLRAIANKHGALTKLIWVQTDKETAKQRATHPDHAKNNTYPNTMTTEHFERISGSFEPPHEDEAAIKLNTHDISSDKLKTLLAD